MNHYTGEKTEGVNYSLTLMNLTTGEYLAPLDGPKVPLHQIITTDFIVPIPVQIEFYGSFGQEILNMDLSSGIINLTDGSLPTFAVTADSPPNPVAYLECSSY